MQNPTINLSEIKGALNVALDDMYSDGIISSAIYNKKTAERFLIWAINSADRHICLQVALDAIVTIYVPANQRTVFFARQAEYVSNFLAQHSDVQTADATQYAYLIAENQYLDVISVLSNYANFYETLPVDEAADPDDIFYHALPQQVEYREGRKYLGTTGTVYNENPTGKKFFVDVNSRKMVLSEPKTSAGWFQLKAQIAPTDVNVTELATSELDDYKIFTPYWAKDWLMIRAINNLISPVAAAQTGYADLEQLRRAEAFQNRPGTGNVTLSGDDMSGGYEGDFTF